MTVKELIHLLSAMNPDAEVLYTENIHMGHHVGGIEKVRYNKDDNGKLIVIIGDFE